MTHGYLYEYSGINGLEYKSNRNSRSIQYVRIINTCNSYIIMLIIGIIRDNNNDKYHKEGVK